MKKLGRRRINRGFLTKRHVMCINCGKKAVFNVVFADNWAKLTVPLCEECAMKEYENLRLQTRFDWVGKK